MSLVIKKITAEELSKNLYFDFHEQVIQFSDRETQLEGFLAIHSTRLGNAVGGTRMKIYPSDADALSDALRLSKAMSYKCAIANVPYGGGKAVIVGGGKIKNDSLLESYGKFLHTLDCLLRTGVDVGITNEDVRKISEHCACMVGVVGSDIPKYNVADMAAFGVYVSIKASTERCLKKKLSNTTIAIKGLGKLGAELVRLLHAENVKLVVADVEESQNSRVREAYSDIEIVDPEIIHTIDCDVYAPCALGNEFDEKSVAALNAKIICGGANNQLSTERIGAVLHERGIVYCPDYLVNAGGLINVVDELEEDGYKKERVLERVRDCGKRVVEIIDASERENKPTSEVADTLAKSILMT